MKTHLLCSLLFSASLLAQTTTITGNITDPAGDPLSGSCSVQAVGPFKATAGWRVIGAPTVIQFSGGAFSVALAPTDSATPSGQYYKVTCVVPQQTINGHRVGPYSWGPNYWLVPTNAAAVDISTVELNAPPPASFQIQWQQLSQNGAQVGQAPIWNGTSWQPGVPASAVPSVFGRTGPIAAQSGDYTTAQVTESSNFYFTPGRVYGALSAAGPLNFSLSNGQFSCPTCLSTGSAYTNPSWLSLSWGGGRISGIPPTFTPSLHSSTHGNAGTDPVSLDASQIATGIFSPARIPQIAYASLSGIPSTFNASQLQGLPVDSATPNDGTVLTYNLATAKWTPKAPSAALSGGIADQLALWKDGTSLQSSGLLVHKNLSGTDVLNFANSTGSYIQWGKVQGFITPNSFLEFYPDPGGSGLMSLMFYKANGSQQAKIYYDYDGQWKMTGFVNQIIRSTPNYGVGGSGSGSWNNWSLCSAGDGACNGIVTMVPYCRFFDPSTAPGGTLTFTLNWTDDRSQPKSYSMVLDLSNTGNSAVALVPAYVNSTSGVSLSAVFAGGNTASWRWQCDVKFN